MFGAPKVMLSDNGNEFINQKVEELLRKFGVKHRLTATYKPRTNGQTERLNAVLGQVVRKISEKNPLDWDEMLPAALMALRSKVHEAHGKTPFEMVFGKKMRIPTEVAVKEPTEEKIERSKEIQGLKKLRSAVRPKMEKYQKTIRETQDKRAGRKIERLAAGNIVFLKRDGLLSKLDCRYRGPYKVQGLTRKGNYKIVDKDGFILENIPSEKLKKCNTNSFGKVEQVLGDRVTNGKIEFLLKMRFEPMDEAKWHPGEKFKEEFIVEKYWNSLRGRKLRKVGGTVIPIKS
jgi:hypothetical protein